MKATASLHSNADPSTLSRRHVLAVAVSAGAIAAVPRIACGAAAGDAGNEQFSRLMADFAEEILVLAPSQATGLGLDSGARAGLKSQLEDYSPAGEAAWTRQVDSMARRLGTLDRGTLGADAQTRYDTLLFSVHAGIEGKRFSYGGGAQSGYSSGTSPYVLSQEVGAITSVPEFLASTHRIENAADAQAYLARVAALARVLDQESDRVAERAAKGIVPPDFIARTALGQMQGFRKTPVATQRLVTSLAERTSKLGIAGDWAGQASRLVTDSVYPALDRQIAAFAKSTAKATDVAGVYRLPDGEAYYQWALKLGTSTTQGADEIHAIGLAQAREIESKIDAILRAQGMTQGTVGRRLSAITRDPKMLYPDNDAGREQIIAFCNSRVDAIRQLMPRISRLGLKAPLQIKRVPKDIEAGAALGYMKFAALDGSRPSIYYINLKSTRLWPRSELTTLTAHEGIPGHAWQGAYLAEHHAEIPLIASMTFFNAFVEGWALYAEQLVDEFGLYADDPFSRIGYLQAQQFRACRLVVDTGLHAKKWTRQQAIRFLVDNTGRGLDAMTSEVDRYAAGPGQACGYKVGHNEMIKQRERARAALGDRFDLAGYNDAIVRSTGVPLTLLPGVVDRFIAASRA